MITNLAEMCRKYDEIISLVNKSRNEQKVFTETLQLQVNIVKSKVETLTALITKGKTTSIWLVLKLTVKLFYFFHIYLHILL